MTLCPVNVTFSGTGVRGVWGDTVQSITERYVIWLTSPSLPNGSAGGRRGLCPPRGEPSRVPPGAGSGTSPAAPPRELGRPSPSSLRPCPHRPWFRPDFAPLDLAASQPSPLAAPAGERGSSSLGRCSSSELNELPGPPALSSALVLEGPGAPRRGSVWEGQLVNAREALRR